jgi:hypothetical protein
LDGGNVQFRLWNYSQALGSQLAKGLADGGSPGGPQGLSFLAGEQFVSKGNVYQTCCGWPPPGPAPVVVSEYSFDVPFLFDCFVSYPPHL